MFCIDKTILSILTVVISGAGVIFELTYKYEPRELNFSFFGENPFAIKKQAIEQTMKSLFMIVIITGLLIQILPIIFSQIPDRQYSNQFYLIFFVLSICFFIFLANFLKKIGIHLARKNWLPSIISSQKQSFEFAKDILEHDGLKPEQMDKNFSNLEECRKANYSSAEEHIKRIERLLEISNSSETLVERKNKLKRFFS